MERYWDRRWEELNAPDAWEHDDPDWTEIADLIDSHYSQHEVADLVRDMIGTDGDLQIRVYEEGLLNEYINPARNLKDPDDEWDEVDRVFTREWGNDDLMIGIWEADDDICRGICEALKAHADRDGMHRIREYYNSRRAERNDV